MGSSDSKEIVFSGAKIPVFRYNRGYKIAPDSIGKYDATRFLQGK